MGLNTDVLWHWAHVFQYFVCTPVQLLEDRDYVMFIFVPQPCIKYSAWYKDDAQIKIYLSELNVSG